MRTVLRALGALTLAISLAGCSAATAAPERILQVYAAASLSKSFDEIAAAFTAANPGVRVVPVYDGSSTLVTQILEGAPADVFASADEANMAKAADAAREPQLFAANTLVLAVPAGNPAGIEALADLSDATVVLCAPEVPCGAASARLLANAGVAVTPASVEQNVTAVLTKVSSGEADAGLVYATDVKGASDVESIVPEGADRVVNRYPIAAMTDAADPALAEAFVAFVLSEAGQDILRNYGFGAP